MSSLIKQCRAILRFARNFLPRNPASASLQDVDANVLFSLKLPPNPAINHKVKRVITLAYDQKTLKSLQSYSLAKCDLPRIKLT
ncbi:hypothetical protein C3709_15315 [Lelliottia aquatilis]|uniref:Uncharacterized protein n=1 Tax=Lelliottia aquatilis TaxID=2080838 RepID=A0ABX5A0T5_9ENTR|nr:hypothetical protein C3712_12090 [Lelliottia aquatilis]POZ26468.1 hypothetical protein C3708_10165 [Lelliottia sp. 7254-16]POZ27717.1 hypothetical protein C3711_08785 [Lelliottia aquatilis]POZ32227.1 hypothetical protein C3710_14180 [Lelliottia aquatilis]POZ37382.1 hypothetical protein C3709_15315 [Lelliottia aquatilis]